MRQWRNRRRLSQLDLAIAAGVSPRHVSLVETGRSRPSADMVLRLATELDVPLRERNRLLVAAGFAPRYFERPFETPDMSAVHAAIVRVLGAHEPYPAVVFDRHWNIVMANRAAAQLLDTASAELRADPVNMVRLALSPEGLASSIVNFADVKNFFRLRLARQLARTGDPVIAALYNEFFGATPPEEGPGPDASEVVIPMLIRHRGHELRLFSTVTTFGTPQDVTLDEISLESYYPADKRSADVLNELAADRSGTAI